MRDLVGKPLSDDALLDLIACDGGAIVSRGLVDRSLETHWRRALGDAGAARGMHLLFTGREVVGVIDTLAAAAAAAADAAVEDRYAPAGRPAGTVDHSTVCGPSEGAFDVDPAADDDLDVDPATEVSYSVDVELHRRRHPSYGAHLELLHGGLDAEPAQ